MPMKSALLEKQSSFHGGKRPRAGRKKNVPNKASVERQARVAATGKTPLDVMLENMRRTDSEAEKLAAEIAAGHATGESFTRLVQLRRLAQECAAEAAPYVHPRLAAIAHRNTNPDGSPVRPIINVYGLSGQKIMPPDEDEAFSGTQFLHTQ
jgi:hypothetical protein